MLLSITKKDTDLARKLCAYKSEYDKKDYENFIILEVIKRYIENNLNVEVTDGLYKLDLDDKPDLIVEGSRVYLEGTRRKGLKLVASVKDSRNIELLGYKKDGKIVEIDNIKEDVEGYEVDLIEDEDAIYDMFVAYQEGNIKLKKKVSDTLLKFPFLKSEYFALLSLNKASLNIVPLDVVLEDSTLDIFTSEFEAPHSQTVSIDVSEDGNTINEYDEEFKEEEAFILEEISSGDVVIQKREEELQEIEDIEELEDVSAQTVIQNEQEVLIVEEHESELISINLDDFEIELEDEPSDEMETDELIELSNEIMENHEELLTEEIVELEEETAELLIEEPHQESEELVIEEDKEDAEEFLDETDALELLIEEETLEEESPAFILDEEELLEEPDDELDFSEDILDLEESSQESLEEDSDQFLEVEDTLESQEDVLEFIDDNQEDILQEESEEEFSVVSETEVQEEDVSKAIEQEFQEDSLEADEEVKELLEEDPQERESLQEELFDQIDVEDDDEEFQPAQEPNLKIDPKYKGVVDPELVRILAQDDDEEEFDFSKQDVEIKPIEQKIPPKKNLLPTVVLLGAICFGGFYAYKNKDVLGDKASTFISSASNRPVKTIKKVQAPPQKNIVPDVKKVKTIELKKTQEKPVIPAVEKEVPKVEAVKELPLIADLPQEKKVFKNIANNVNKPAVKTPKTIDEVITKGFDPSASAVVVQKVSWEIPQEVSEDYSMKKYLIITGKAIKMNLAQDLLFANDMVTNSRIKLKIQFNSTGSSSEIVLRNSSGSVQVDALILQSVKETISYTKIPSINTNKGLIKLNLIINL